MASLCNGDLRAVGDGSHKDGLDTDAVGLEATPNDCVETVLRTPGSSDDMQSHRAELSGLFAVITVVEILEQVCHVTNGCITVGCDNKAALHIMDLDCV